MRLFGNFDVSDYKTMLPTPVRGTCQWILGHPLYISWLEKAENALLWLTGPTGCGKTILSLFLAKQLEDTPMPNKQSRHTNVCVFFCDDKVREQKDGKNILTGMIFQLVRHRRSLIRHANRVYEMQGQNLVRSFTALWTIFVNIATDPASGPTYIIIDALDECEEATRQSLLQSIRAFKTHPQDRQSASSRHVKFILTGRPSLKELEHSDDAGSEHRIPIDENLESGHGGDIWIFIQQRVEEICRRRRFSSEIQDFLQQTLLSQSGQTFLWIHLVLESLQNSPLSSKKDLQDVISRTPAKLEAAYLTFLSAIPPGVQDAASKLLKLVLGSSRPLSLDEINIAYTIDPSHRTAQNVTSSCQTAMPYTLQAVLGPLVRVSDSKVALVHQSAKEFILQRVGSEDDGLSPELRAIDIEDCALAIASACVEYLLLNDFSEDFFDPNNSPTLTTSDASDSYERSPSSTSALNIWDENAEDLGADMLFRDSGALDEEICQVLVSKYAFYQYAALHWTEHLALCEASAPLQLRDAAKGLLGLGTNNSSNWLRFSFADAAARDKSVPGSRGAIVLAAYFNLHETLKDLLGSQEAVPQQDLDHALFWGAEQGHARIVDTLLNAGANPNAQVSGRRTALIASSENDHRDCVATLLVCDRTDPNTRGNKGRTALSYACGYGHSEIVQALLSRDDCKPDQEDDSGSTSLFWAVGGGHTSVVSTLLALSSDRVVDVNHSNKEGRTAVSWAAGGGRDDVLRTLLKARGIDVNLKDKLGRSPLAWAARNGCTTVVRLLMRHSKVDKGSLDNDQRNAISWACEGGRVDTLRMLLKYACPGVDDRDVDGWTPLAWAIQTNSPETVDTLISTRAVDLERGDHSRRTALSWAVEYGHLEVVRTLLRAGANPKTSNETGITPLSTAEKLGREDLREELLSYLGGGPGQRVEGSGGIEGGARTEVV